MPNSNSAARRDRQAQLNQQCLAIEENNQKGKTRDLFKKVRELKNHFSPRNATIANHQGKQLSDGQQIKNTWREYTEQLYQSDDTGIPTATPAIHDDGYELEPDILQSEVEWAVGALNKGKAPGEDEIPIELIQALGNDATKVITSLCQQIWKTKQWPNEWRRSIFIPIPKKTNAKDCSNYRTIAHSYPMQAK